MGAFDTGIPAEEAARAIHSELKAYRGDRPPQGPTSWPRTPTTSRSSSWPSRATSPEAAEGAAAPMTLVQIGLPRDRAQAPATQPDPSASLSSEAVEGESSSTEAPDLEDSPGPPGFALALAGGLVLLAPLALPARDSRSALVLLLVGLLVLALIAALLHTPGCRPLVSRRLVLALVLLAGCSEDRPTLRARLPTPLHFSPSHR
jgi:hypothetical protein